MVLMVLNSYEDFDMPAMDVLYQWLQMTFVGWNSISTDTLNCRHLRNLFSPDLELVV